MKKTILLCLIPLIINSAVQARKLQYSASQFGIVPNQGTDMGPALRKALEAIRTSQKAGDCAVLVLDKGCYDFYPDGAVKKELYVSNHDQDNPKSIAVLVDGMHDITIDGSGADIMCHGTMIPVVIQNSQRITLQNLHIDFRTPHIGQAQIVQITPQGTVLKTAPWMNARVSPDGRLQHFCDEGHGAQWVCTPQAAIAFDQDTRHIVYRTSDVVLWPQKAIQTGPDTFLLEGWHNDRLSVGNILALRDWSRPTPGIFLAHNRDTRILNTQVHYADGMALIAQLCENITLDGFCVSLRSADDPRYFTSQADATHFSGCKGRIISRNGLYEHMMDDAINVHGTYVKVMERIDDTTLRCAYQHGQSWGFDWGYAGDQVSIVRSRTMEKLDCGPLRIHSISNLRDGTDNLFGQKEMIIRFDRPLPAEVTPDGSYGIENLTWTPSVYFAHNTIRNNRARGSLFSTPRKVVCENNFFDHTSGTAILLCGDCNGWYETGACRDVLIRNNHFLNALTSPFQFTNAVISIYPEIPELDRQKEYFHGGPLAGHKYAIRITGNLFETFDQPLLYAKSVDGLQFSKNRVIHNNDYPAYHWITQPVTLERVINYSEK